jgi:tRNA (adenine57-N1/adenine58-N1)-methyltransferase
VNAEAAAGTDGRLASGGPTSCGPAPGEAIAHNEGESAGGAAIRPFLAGEKALLIDSKGRRHLVTLRPGGQFHTHAGVVAHDCLIGQDEAVTVRSSHGARYLAVRPTLAEVVLEMPRGAQVIYPKDLGPLLIMADIFPGAKVLEAGLGSGALSMALLRAGAHVTGYEVREDFAARAIANVTSFLGEEVLGRYDVEVRDLYEGITESGLDRVLLDLPEPWRAVDHAAAALRPGGIFIAYLPSVTQVMALREALPQAGFVLAETVEVLQRSWHIEGQSVRPDHRMVAHTGFLTAARSAGERSARPTGDGAPPGAAYGPGAP